MSAAFMSAATASMTTAAAVRRGCMSAAAVCWRCVRCVHAPCTGMGNRGVATSPVVATSAVIVVGGRCVTAVAVIASAPLTGEAMGAPSVTIAPSGPRSHAQEDAIVEIARPVKAHGGAAVGSIVVIAVGAYGLNADANDNLRMSRWRDGQSKQ